MILILLGTQDAPFPRIIETTQQALVELEWSQAVIVQAGHTHYTTTSPQWRVTDFLSQAEFEEAITQAEVVICHGGAGTMLTALKKGKQVIVMARKLEFSEHNNDHQAELASKLAQEGYLQSVQTRSEMQAALQAVQAQTFQPRPFDFVNDVVNQVEHLIDLIEV